MICWPGKVPNVGLTSGDLTLALRNSPPLRPAAHLGTPPLLTRPAAWTAPVRSSSVLPSGHRLLAPLLHHGRAACRRPRHRPRPPASQALLRRGRAACRRPRHRPRPPATQAFATTSPSSCSSASSALLPSASSSPSPSQPRPQALSRPHLRPSGIRRRHRHPRPRRHRHPRPRSKLPRPRLAGGSHSRLRSSREMTAALVTNLTLHGGLQTRRQMLHRGGGRGRVTAHAAGPVGPATPRPATWGTSSSVGSPAPRLPCRASG